MKLNALKKELSKRSTAELTQDGQVLQITQAIAENPKEVKMLVFGELTTKEVRPIEECCSNCDFGKRHFGSIEQCQARQSKDAKARGFSQVICPRQFID